MTTDSPTVPTARPGRIGAALCLVTIALIHIGLSASWMYRNGFFAQGRPPCHDAAYFRLDALEILEGLEQRGFPGWVAAAAGHESSHPPLLPMFVALASKPSGDVSVTTQWYVLTGFFVLLVFGAYRLARNFGGRWFAILTAAAISTISVLVVSARVMYPKFPMLVLVLWALDAIVRSRGFSRTGWSVAAGALAGVSALSFMLAPLYIIGSALTALAIGLARRGTRGRVALNTVFAIVAAAVVCLFWYGEHWRAVVNYTSAVTGSKGQSLYSQGVSLFDPGRWLFYPLAVVNTGLGFFPAVMVMLLAVARPMFALARALMPLPISASARAYPGLVLTAGAILSFVVVVPGQTWGNSEYVINLPPLLMLFACDTIARIRAAWLRQAAGLLLGVTCLISLGLAYRGVHRDQPLSVDLAGARIDVIGEMDRYLGKAARDVTAQALPQGDDWYVDEFLDLRYQNAQRPEVRFGQIGPLHAHDLNAGNFGYEARRRGVPFTTIDLAGLPDPTDEEIDRFSRSVDYLLIDQLCFQRQLREGPGAGVLPRFRTRLEALGLRLKEYPGPHIVAGSDIVVYQFVDPAMLPWSQPRSVLDEDGVTRRGATFENGWRLLGTRIERQEKGRARLVAYWEIDPPRQGWVRDVRARGARGADPRSERRARAASERGSRQDRPRANVRLLRNRNDQGRDQGRSIPLRLEARGTRSSGGRTRRPYLLGASDLREIHGLSPTLKEATPARPPRRIFLLASRDHLDRMS